MKLASLKKGRDGSLVVVSRDLTRFRPVTEIAPTLQHALEHWDECAPKLRQVYQQINDSDQDTQPFELELFHSPLPRAFQWADGSAYINHVELVRKARNAEVPESFYHDPLMYQGASDGFIAPTDDIVADPEWGIDFEAEVAVITGDVPMGATPEQAAEGIRLVTLVNDVSMRGLIPAELAKGFGFLQSKPASAFSPVAVTPDELDSHWRDHKLHLPLLVELNGKPFGRPNAGVDMTFDFAQLVAHVAKTRHVGAGSIVGSGTVSNKQGNLWGSSIENGGVGYCCLAEVRMYEAIEEGAPKTPFMRPGDVVRIEMKDEQGQDIFGPIINKVSAFKG